MLGAFFLIGIVILGMAWFSGAPDIATLEDEQYRRVNAYLLPEQSSVKFNFSSSAATTKLLFYALVDQSETSNHSDEKTAFRYSIEYRFGQTDAFQRIDLSTQITDYRSLETDQLTPAYRLPEIALRVSDSRSLEFSIPPNKRKTLELRLVSKDQNLEGVVFRSYYTESTTMRDSRRRWARLSRRDQNRLARFHPFGRHYLSDIEIQNVLSNRNQIIAPSGVSGQDFTQRSLWSYRHPDLLIADSTSDAQKKPNLGPNFKQSLRVLQNAQVEFRYQVLAKQSARVIFWHRGLDGNVTQGSFTSLSEEGSETLNLDAGDYVFYADQLMNVEVASSEYIELSQLSRRFYPINTNALIYTLESPNSEQLIKVDFLAPPDIVFGIKYEFKTESDELVSNGVLNHQQTLDAFSSILKGAHAGTESSKVNHVSKSSEKIINVPEGASKFIILPHKNAGLIRISNSLESLAPKVVFAGEGSRFHSNWFELKPEFINSITHKDNTLPSSIVSVKERATWVTSFEKYAFSVNTAPVQVRRLATDELLPVIDLYEPIVVNDVEPKSAIMYRPVKLNQTFEIDVETSIEGDKTVVLQALYQGASNDLKPLSISIDGKHYSYDLLNTMGTISLPAISTGKHNLRVQAEKNLKVFLSHLASGSEQSNISYKKRSFLQFSSQITYRLPRSIKTDQTLQILLADTGVSEPINLAINAINSQKKRLIRRIQILPQKNEKTNMLNLSGQRVYSMSPAIYLPLETLEGFEPHQIELSFDDTQKRLISVALLDRSSVQINRAFSDTIDASQSKER